MFILQVWWYLETILAHIHVVLVIAVKLLRMKFNKSLQFMANTIQSRQNKVQQRVHFMEHVSNICAQCHTRPKAKRDIAMLSVDKFPYPRNRTRDNEFHPCSKDACHILKCFHNFKPPESPFILHNSPYQLSIARSNRSGEENGLWSQRDRHCASSLTFFSRYISCWWRQTLNTCIYFTFINQWEVRVSTMHGIKVSY